MGDKRGEISIKMVMGVLVFVGWIIFMNWYMNRLHPDAVKNLMGTKQQTNDSHSVSVTPLTGTPANSEHVVSVAPLTSATDVAAAGWKTAEVTLDGKKFKVFYVRKESMVFDWGDMRQSSVIYHLKDEATASGISPGDYGFFVFLGTYDGMFLAAKERLDEAHYRSDSPLQKIILSNKEEEGKEIFRQIFDQLEVIEGPKK